MWLPTLITATVILALTTLTLAYTTPESTWRCPEIALKEPEVECSCDIPHTLRCTGDREAMRVIGRKLRSLPQPDAVSLLDCTVQNVSALPGSVLEGVALHGLVVSSGEIRDVHKQAFVGLTKPLQALGLPNNQLSKVPTAALTALPTLDRLDLSHNLLQVLDQSSFDGLGNLSFLDLSDNRIQKIAPDAFTTLPVLHTLRLRGNNLKLSTIKSLCPHEGLHDLDLSSNNLAGPLGQNIICGTIASLRTLILAHNLFTSIKKGALAGLPNLTSLSLHHNSIDVLEDFAFENLPQLLSLDLSYNRIVAVSSASLGRLKKLTTIDLSHNFLRAVTGDLITPLVSLKELKLDDNDISIVASDALNEDILLQRLSLADNPLNCDCSLSSFAQWLTNSTTLPDADKSTATCATPPLLENALLVEIQPQDLHCGENPRERDRDFQREPIMEPPSSLVDEELVNNVHATLIGVGYEADGIHLDWSVDPKALPYVCKSLFIYEDQGVGEFLIETKKLECNSRNLTDPTHLAIVLKNDVLKISNFYRFCLILLLRPETDRADTDRSDNGSLILDCSDIVQLKKKKSNFESFENRQTKIDTLKIDSSQSNRSEIVGIDVDFSVGNVIVNVNVIGSKLCSIKIEIYDQNTLKSTTSSNCSNSQFIFTSVDLNGLGPYKVCASLLGLNVTHCETKSWRGVIDTLGAMRLTIFERYNVNVLLVCICTVLFVIFCIFLWSMKKILTRPKLLSVDTQQYFLPPEYASESGDSTRYIKLLATTKV